MAISATCSSCQKQYRFKDEAAGKRIKCPGCQQVLIVPAPLDFDPFAADPPGQPAVRASASDQETPSLPAAGAGSKKSWAAVAGGILTLVVCGAGGLTYWQGKQWANAPADPPGPVALANSNETPPSPKPEEPAPDVQPAADTKPSPATTPPPEEELKDDPPKPPVEKPKPADGPKTEPAKPLAPPDPAPPPGDVAPRPRVVKEPAPAEAAPKPQAPAEQPTWQTDFDRFAGEFDELVRKNLVDQEFDKRYTGKTVRWQLTFKNQARSKEGKRSLVFDMEPFGMRQKLFDSTRFILVSFEPAPQAVLKWDQLKPGASVLVGGKVQGAFKAILGGRNFGMATIGDVVPLGEAAPRPPAAPVGPKPDPAARPSELLARVFAGADIPKETVDVATRLNANVAKWEAAVRAGKTTDPFTLSPVAKYVTAALVAKILGQPNETSVGTIPFLLTKQGDPFRGPVYRYGSVSFCFARGSLDGMTNDYLYMLKYAPNQPNPGNAPPIHNVPREQVSILVINREFSLELDLLLENTDTKTRFDKKLAPGDVLLLRLPKGKYTFVAGSYKNGKLISGTGATGGGLEVEKSEKWIWSLKSVDGVAQGRSWDRRVEAYEAPAPGDRVIDNRQVRELLETLGTVKRAQAQIVPGLKKSEGTEITRLVNDREDFVLGKSLAECYVRAAYRMTEIHPKLGLILDGGKSLDMKVVREKLGEEEAKQEKDGRLWYKYGWLQLGVDGNGRVVRVAFHCAQVGEPIVIKKPAAPAGEKDKSK